MEHQAARPKAHRSTDDEPTSQPMRPSARGQIARNPSTDQKRVRRSNQRKVADFNERGSGAAWVPGQVSCRSCGHVGQPRLGDGTGSNCGRCGSYSVSKTRPSPTGGQAYPQNARNLGQGDYARTSAREDESSSPDNCAYCNQVRPLNGDGLCAQHADKAVREADDRWQSDPYDDEHGYYGSKTATVRESNAEWLNPGDSIRTPNGKTQRVQRVRPHETSASHVYVDTDGGTALVNRTDRFTVVPTNSQQQSLPGYGTPGGNSNHLPFDPQTSGTNSAPTSQCPVCGTKDSLSRQGDHYQCSRCGYREQFGGAGGHAFSDSPSVVRTFSTINTPLQSVIARRAQQVLDQKENPL